MMQAAAMAACLQLNVDPAYGPDHGWRLHIGSRLRY